ncbi:acyl-CoA dehydrogenase family protein [uncultured Psychrobacter sp.]|uniref:acyl-CoA dehydrogenase family protein n=1 Tax=uncultured Psychrobacter sp. TaxID=259303 RepID=UPI00261602AE|nr:acyl-CoA dehydrogenase family protein [uncultured Psychrobacter sp.]
MKDLKPLIDHPKLNELLSDIRQRADDFEAQRHIDQDIIERFKEIGVYRAFVPKRFGGDERSPTDFLSLIETISMADGSAGWVASFGMNPFYLGGLPLETIDKVWAETPDVVFAGAIFPMSPAQEQDDSYIVSGRWKFASGCKGASLIGVGIKPETEGALPRMAVMPAEQVTIDETWDMIGMRATGSHDVVADNVTVPKEWTFVRGGNLSLTEPLFKYPSLSLATQVLAVTILGLAREALNIITGEARGRKSVTGAPNLGEREYVQIAIGKAEAKIHACKAFFYQATDDVWATIMAGDEPSDAQINLLRLSSSHLTHECVEVIRTVYKLMGMTSAQNSHAMTRIYRDSSLVAQHAFMGEITFRNAGAMAFDHAPYPGYL